MRFGGGPRAIVVATVIALSPTARAGGFYVPEIGARGVAMGAAMTAQDADATAIFHNPAGIAGSDDQVQVAGDAFFPSVTWFRRPVADPSTGKTVSFAPIDNTNAVIAAPFAGATSRVGKRGLTVGLALYAPFGAAVTYPEDGSQRQVVTGIDLKTIYVSPTAAMRVSDDVRIGASLSWIYSSIALHQRNALPYVTGDPEQYPNPDPGIEGDTAITGTDPASLGATFGVQWRPAAWLSAGASVMLPTTLHFEGNAVVVNESISMLTDANGNMIQAAGQRSDTVHMTVPLPLVARVGVAARPTPTSLVALDVNWQRWSTFRALVVDFQHEWELLPTPGANLYDVTVENDWRDTWSVRLGGELRPTRPLALRGGLVYDQSPIDDRHFSLLTPDSDKIGVSAGAAWSWRLGDGQVLDVEAGYMHLFVHERDVDPAGGSAGTVLNKPAPSFYYGVARARFDIASVSLSFRI
jgi:long-chain fatty acid transport protein